MTEKMLNIPAVLIHTVDDVKYKVNGTIVGINESTNTCSMKFKGYDVQTGIPMQCVYLNEAFLDKIKEYGKAAWNGIKKFVKVLGGLLLPEDNEGNIDMNFINSPINIAIESKVKGSPVKLYPSAGMLQTASENNIKLPNANKDICDDIVANSERSMIQKYWARVMNAHVANESFTALDAIHYVNEHYYKVSDIYNKSINESVAISLRNPIKNLYGREVNTKKLRSILTLNIMQQLSGKPGKHSDTKPVLIWGAPGIGKTAIVKQTIAGLKEKYGMDLAIQHILGGSMYRDDYVLPDTKKNVAGEIQATDVPKLWLPVYKVPVNPEALEVIDYHYNSGLYQYTENDLTDKEGKLHKEWAKEYYGGIIFVDEFSRMPEQSKNIIMNVINDHVYNGLYLASRWGWVLAANRAMDMTNDQYGSAISMEADVEEVAKVTRYEQYTFVPTKSEWLEWARSINDTDGLQNVDEMFCTFIEQSPDAVWYDALEFGSRDDEALQKYTNIAVNKGVNSTDGSTNLGAITNISMDELDNIITDIRNSVSGRSKISWVPRTWEATVNNGIIETLYANIFMRNDELFGDLDKIKQIGQNIKAGMQAPMLDNGKSYDIDSDGLKYDSKGWFEGIFRNGSIDVNLLKASLNKIPEEQWELAYDLISDEPNTSISDNRFDVFMHWVGERIKDITGDNNKPSTYWNTYQQYRQTFTPQVCASIWNSSKLPTKQLQDDDDLTFDRPYSYLGTETSKWKAQTYTAKDVFDLILDSYPGGDAALVAQLQKDNKALKAHPVEDMTDAEFTKLFDKFVKQYNVKVDGKTYYTLCKPQDINTTKAKRLSVIKNMVNVLAYSDFAKQFANVANYIVKVSIQCGSDAQIGIFFNEFLAEWLVKHASASKQELEQMSDKFVDANIDSAPAEVVLSTQVWYPAVNILYQGTKLKHNQATGKI